MPKGFYWETDAKGFTTIGYADTEVFPKEIHFTVAPAHGSNLCQLCVDGHAIIDYDEKLLQEADYTGTPVLYPTPNRVRDAIFCFDGNEYPQKKFGKDIFEHGLVHDEPWEFTQPQVTDNKITFQTWIRFTKRKGVFEAFPFEHTLKLTYILSHGMVCVKYSVENTGNKRLPFGFGLHPYFMKLSGDDGTKVLLPADYVMETTEDLLPTGRLIAVDGSAYDLRVFKGIGKLDLDHVFTGIEKDRFTEILYEGLGMKVRIQSTKDFSHLVLYSPTGQDFFCLESQTCSTDAHNLYDQGFVKESGLKIVEPGKSFTGQVCYKMIGV